MEKPGLEVRKTAGSKVEELSPGCWRLSLPEGGAGKYRWAQLDDYMTRRRSAFLWEAPCSLSLCGRVSAQNLPGTWGFGLWNDPFNLSFGLGGMARRVPALPETAWFFYASPPNHLALHDDHPAQGMLAATFRSTKLPAWMVALGSPALPFLKIPTAAAALRRLAGNFINESAAALDLDLTGWHEYRLDWKPGGVSFSVDGTTCFETPVSPGGRLGLVIWIDNQYMRFPPDGVLRAGTLSNPACWLELQDIRAGEINPGFPKSAQR